MDHRRELLKGNTPTLVLAVLRDGARHGYGVAREIERRTGDALALKEGTLYPPPCTRWSATASLRARGSARPPAAGAATGTSARSTPSPRRGWPSWSGVPARGTNSPRPWAA
jgi:hypothetical protein